MSNNSNLNTNSSNPFSNRRNNGKSNPNRSNPSNQGNNGKSKPNRSNPSNSKANINFSNKNSKKNVYAKVGEKVYIIPYKGNSKYFINEHVYTVESIDSNNFYTISAPGNYYGTIKKKIGKNKISKPVGHQYNNGVEIGKTYKQKNAKIIPVNRKVNVNEESGNQRILYKVIAKEPKRGLYVNNKMPSFRFV